MGTWYDPAELKGEAKNLQRQPEFDPDLVLLGEDDDTVEGEISDELQTAFDRINEIAAIVADEIVPNQ